jgi:hypothetical protein
MKIIVTVLMTLGLLVSLVACVSYSMTPSVQSTNTSAKLEDDGYPSGDDVVKSYLNDFKNADFNKMMGTFAIESYAKTGNREDILSRQADVEWMIQTQYLTLTSPNLLPQPTVFTNEEAFATKMADLVNPKLLQTIEFEEFLDLNFFTNDIHSSQNILDELAKQAKLSGAEKIEERCALFIFYGQEYTLSADVALYNGKWRMLGFSNGDGIGEIWLDRGLEKSN